jgi:two-component system, LytTR family, sensor kinase
LILCGWTIVALLFSAQQMVVAKVQGSEVHWAIEGALELVWWYVWAAYTPLVIGLAKRFPLMGPRVVLHIAIHTIT